MLTILDLDWYQYFETIDKSHHNTSYFGDHS